MKGRLKKSSDALREDNINASVKHLLSFIYENLSDKQELPRGITGATITELYKILLETKKDISEDRDKLKEWIEKLDE